MKNMNNILYATIPLLFITTPLVGFADDGHPVTVTIESSSTNDSLTASDPLSFNESIGFSQDITKHTYYSLTTTAPQDHEIDTELDVGLQTQYHDLIPFTELEMINEHTQGSDRLVFDYDVGTAYQLTQHIYPVVIFDGVGINGNDTLIYGVKYVFNDNVATTVDAFKSLKETGSGVQCKLAYTFL